MKDYIEGILKITLESYRCETVVDGDGKRMSLVQALTQGDCREAATSELAMLTGDLAHALLPVTQMLHASANVLRDAGALFRQYEVLHRAKVTVDATKKAEVNAAMALRIEETLLNLPDALPQAWTEDQIADACIAAGVSDSKYEAILIALKG